MKTEIYLPFISKYTEHPLNIMLERSVLENLVRPIVERCSLSLDQAISDAKLSKSDITKIIMVGGPTRMPIVQKFVEDYVGRKIEHGIDPMECVCFGAAIQAAVLTGDVKDILLLDVTPLTLGLETLGGVRTPLIDRNTTVPVKKTQVFTTASDNQPSVEVNVLQGERPMAKDNLSLGRFVLDGIPPAPRGMPQIEVTFDIDANGILNVSAKDKGTGKEQSIKITSSTKLSKEDIDKYVKEAQAFAADDAKHKEEIEAKNETDNLVYSVEKSLKDHGDKISADERLSVEQALSAAKDALKGSDINAIKSAKDNLAQASQKLGEAVYKATQQTQGGPTPPPQGPAEHQQGPASAGGEDQVVDAEVVDDGKK
jgi:molecular chaperone DnaK